MRHDSRLSRMLHALVHMDRLAGAATSEMLARMLNTNPVVVRRTMGGLRRHGLVRSEKGHGGGWVLARTLDEISLLDIYRALDEPQLFALGPSVDNPDCLVEQAVNGALDMALVEAKAVLLARLEKVTLGDLGRHFTEKLGALPRQLQP
ncbi:Rrf2 family transcriptional regulator [Niveispirillum sp. KHB5.9]|uniref:Rrf2 family transcriptional regulator n=1 Tax=Niveispirillum sp. KHB5.9 TaxID=3400269 RepID=UPI003A8AA523